MIEVSNELGNGSIAPHSANPSAAVCRLSPSASARFSVNDTSRRPMDTPHSAGLDIATTAILEAQVDISDPVTLAKVVKEYTGHTIDYGELPEKERSAALAGWTCLSKAAPDCGLWARLIEDVSTSVDVYGRVELSDTARPVVEDLLVEVVS